MVFAEYQTLIKNAVNPETGVFDVAQLATLISNIESDAKAFGELSEQVASLTDERDRFAKANTELLLNGNNDSPDNGGTPYDTKDVELPTIADIVKDWSL